MNRDFELRDFLPYVANQAAEALSLTFQKTYRQKYGMLRNEWRVLFHLGQYGDLTAKDICARALMHKTKVSRAVAALESKRFVTRAEMVHDRRHALLSLTRLGKAAYRDLFAEARKFDHDLRSRMSQEEADILHRCLTRLSGLDQTMQDKPDTEGP